MRPAPRARGGACSLCVCGGKCRRAARRGPSYMYLYFLGAGVRVPMGRLRRCQPRAVHRWAGFVGTSLVLCTDGPASSVPASCCAPMPNNAHCSQHLQCNAVVGKVVRRETGNGRGEEGSILERIICIQCLFIHYHCCCRPHFHYHHHRCSHRYPHRRQ